MQVLEAIKIRQMPANINRDRGEGVPTQRDLQPFVRHKDLRRNEEVTSRTSLIVHQLIVGKTV